MFSEARHKVTANAISLLKIEYKKSISSLSGYVVLEVSVNID